MQKLEHSFILPSGVECTIREMDGSHQRILTEQSKMNHGEKLNTILADIIVKVGSETKITTQFVSEMLACDKKAALVEARQFSVGEDSVQFTWTYIDSNGVQREHEEEVILPDGKFPIKKLQTLNEDGEFVDVQYSEYADIKREIEITLPRSGKKVTFTLLDGKGEAIGIATKKSQRSSHTLLKMRRPTYKDEETGTPILLDFDKMSIRDIEYLRQQIRAYEGDVDTTIIFEHPEAEFLPKNEQMVTEDLLGMVAFFFPSGVI